MHQHERSERSKQLILGAALRLFSQRGYGATSIRDIAEAAGVSTGNLYHQFPDKETIFNSLLNQYWQAVSNPDYPVNRALADGAFPNRLLDLGRAVREAVMQYRPYVALIYVDVVEFEGSHIRRFYADMATRFQSFLDQHADSLHLEQQLRPEVSPVSAVMLTVRLLFSYFSVELIFGVPNQYGRNTGTVLQEMADILQHGMLKSPPASAAGPKKPARRRTAPPGRVKAVARRSR